MAYKISDMAAFQFPTMSTQIDGVPVSLCGKELTVTRPGVNGGPPLNITARPATQAQLKRLHQEGHPFVELVPDGDSREQANMPNKPAVASGSGKS